MFKNSNRNQCIECSSTIRTKKRKYTYSDVCMLLETMNCKMITQEDDYIDTKHKITIECQCGNHFVSTIHDIKENKLPICRACANKRITKTKTKSYSMIKQNIENNGNKLITTENNYKNTRSKLEIQCNCGEIFITDYNTYTVYNKFRCNNCSKKLSLGEYKIKTFLKDNNIDFIEQYKFSDCINVLPLPFDFAIFNNNKLHCLI